MLKKAPQSKSNTVPNQTEQVSPGAKFMKVVEHPKPVDGYEKRELLLPKMISGWSSV